MTLRNIIQKSIITEENLIKLLLTYAFFDTEHFIHFSLIEKAWNLSHGTHKNNQNNFSETRAKIIIIHHKIHNFTKSDKTTSEVICLDSA